MQAILHELPLSAGSVSVKGVVSYSSQVPWLFSSSVQKNILFGLPMDKERYNKVSYISEQDSVCLEEHRYAKT